MKVHKVKDTIAMNQKMQRTLPLGRETKILRKKRFRVPLETYPRDHRSCLVVLQWKWQEANSKGAVCCLDLVRKAGSQMIDGWVRSCLSSDEVQVVVPAANEDID